MDGVLEAATALCVCKLACSLLFLPSLSACFSPVSFCSCCLLIFTDFLLAVFLGFLYVFQSWLSLPLADVVALRSLLFLSHTYGAVLLLSTPLLAVETLVRLLWPRRVAARRSRGPLLDCQPAKAKAAAAAEEEEEEKDKKLFHVVGYFCCLSLWVVVAFKVRREWRLEEVWAAACWYTTDSLLRCLPRMHSLVPSAGPPCWGMVVLLLLLALLLLLLFILVTTSLDRRLQAPAGSDGEVQQVSPAPVRRVDPGRAESSCGAHGVQMSACLHGDSVLASPARLPGRRGRREHGRTMSGFPLTFIREEQADSLHRWRLGAFPCPGLDVMIGFVSVLSIFVLPLYLSVNILLIRTVEALLEDCIISLVPPPVHTGDTPPSHNETVV